MGVLPGAHKPRAARGEERVEHAGDMTAWST